jgi:hypothetical protein
MGEYDEVLVYDIECATHISKKDITKHIMRIFGCYSFKTNKYYLLTDKEKIYRIINSHRIFVGFNNIGYDNRVMYENGYKDIIQKNNWGDCIFNNYKINIDMYKIFKDRAGAMDVNGERLDDLLMHYSLDFISQTIGIAGEKDGKIKNFDYSLFNPEPNEWSEEDKKKIVEYTKQDLVITKNMYLWLENYFKDFKDYIDEKDIRNKKYLNTTTAGFAYKAICKAMNWEEEYQQGSKEQFDGAYVSYPAGGEFEGDIYCLDFNSLYPSIMHQCNIYSPDNEGWNGGKHFHSEGTYNDKELGKVEQLLRKWYEQRVCFKKMKDGRQYSIKIIINTIYGVLGNVMFKKLYNNTSAGDVTRIGRQWVLLARKRFREAGYYNIYSDTDSCYILDKYNDKERMLKVKDAIIEEIFESVPFPYRKRKIGVINGEDVYSGFDMGIDAEIEKIWFFQGGNKEKDLELDEDDIINKPKGFMKKNYIYLTKDGKVKVKNMRVRQKNTSPFTRKVFWEYMVASGKIKNEKTVKFPKSFYEDLIKKLLNEDISLASIRYPVNEPESYKKSSQLQAQIGLRYGGAGLYFLIPNFKVGVGKGKKYCTIEEYKENNLTIDDVDLSNIWSELNHFVIGGTKKIKGNKIQNNTSLDAFFK